MEHVYNNCVVRRLVVVKFESNFLNQIFKRSSEFVTNFNQLTDQQSTDLFGSHFLFMSSLG